jgi:hypothetical protein
MVSHWVGAIVLVCLIAFIFLAFRKGFQVKPDPDRKVEDWIGIAWFGKGRQPTIGPPKKKRWRTDGSK